MPLTTFASGTRSIRSRWHTILHTPRHGWKKDCVLTFMDVLFNMMLSFFVLWSGFKEIYVGKNGFVTDVSNGTFAAVGFSDVFDDATYTTTGNTIIVSYKAQTATVANNPRKSCTINNNNIEYVKQADGIKLTHVRFRSVPCIDALFVPTPNEQTAKKVVTTFFDGTFFEPAVYDASFAKDANYTWTEAMPSIPGFVQSLKGFDAFLADTKTGVWSKIVFPKGDWVYTEVDKCVIGDNKGNTASKPDGTECGTYDGMVKWCFNDQGLVEHSTFSSSQVWDDCYWEKKSKKDTAKTVIASFFDQSLAQSITYHSLYVDLFHPVPQHVQMCMCVRTSTRARTTCNDMLMRAHASPFRIKPSVKRGRLGAVMHRAMCNVQQDQRWSNSHHDSHWTFALLQVCRRHNHHLGSKHAVLGTRRQIQQQNCGIRGMDQRPPNWRESMHAQSRLVESTDVP